MSVRQAVADAVRQNIDTLKSTPVIAGFDGFVDEMITVVGEREGLDSFTPVSGMDVFGQMMSRAAGRSALTEIVVNRTDAGGCAVNLGDGIATLGVPLHYYGTLGSPRHSAFDAFAQKCADCTVWGKSYGRTLALEFDDGKYMLSAVSQLAEFNESLIEEVLADGKFAEACGKAGLIAIANWTLYPHMTACWRKLQHDVFSKMTHKPWLFIDLVDPRTRSQEDIADMLEAVMGFEENARVIFGGNLNEANAIAEVLGLSPAVEELNAVADQAARIREKLGVTEVVTHCVKIAGMATADNTAFAEGPYCAKPVKTVGAGDRFNAGLCAGRLIGLNEEQALILGKACSGYFVRNAHSGSALQLAEFIEQWDAGSLN